MVATAFHVRCGVKDQLEQRLEVPRPLLPQLHEEIATCFRAPGQTPTDSEGNGFLESLQAHTHIQICMHTC